MRFLLTAWVHLKFPCGTKTHVDAYVLDRTAGWLSTWSIVDENISLIAEIAFRILYGRPFILALPLLNSHTPSPLPPQKKIDAGETYISPAASPLEVLSFVKPVNVRIVAYPLLFWFYFQDNIFLQMTFAVCNYWILSSKFDGTYQIKLNYDITESFWIYLKMRNIEWYLKRIVIVDVLKKIKRLFTHLKYLKKPLNYS